jgi:soluble lytic murein transglycosylase-like protein
VQIAMAAAPQAGRLAAALRLEAAHALLELARDPWPALESLLAHPHSSAHGRAAGRVLREAWQRLPLDTLRKQPRRTLPRSLRRELDAVLAVRGEDAALGLRMVHERDNDAAALRVARWLSERAELSPTSRLEVGRVLLTGGAWRDAAAVLAAITLPPGSPRQGELAFLRGRAAYRLGQLDDASVHFAAALAPEYPASERFVTAVQVARIAEIRGDFTIAIGRWDLARELAPREIEGWDGSCRCRVALDRAAEAAELTLRAPPIVLRVMGSRCAAALLAAGQSGPALRVLARLSQSSGVVRLLRVAALVQSGNHAEARTAAADLLADPHAGAWRELVLELLPSPVVDKPGGVVAERDVNALARLAAANGAPSARLALGLALARDPAWVSLLAGASPEPATWLGPARDLFEVGLVSDAARLYPESFPSDTPLELAWTASTLARAGNSPAALTVGERLWARLGVPAILVPETLRARILPDELVGDCRRAANSERLPEAWLIGLIRQESRFDVEAYSAAGAVGLAQFVPEALIRLNASLLDAQDGERALKLASIEAARLNAAFGPRLAVIAAAYNAGDPVISAWLAAFGRQIPEPLFAAAIPYRETQTYVLAVREGAELAALPERRPAQLVSRLVATP